MRSFALKVFTMTSFFLSPPSYALELGVELGSKEIDYDNGTDEDTDNLGITISTSPIRSGQIKLYAGAGLERVSINQLDLNNLFLFGSVGYQVRQFEPFARLNFI